jgi:hypothetical protein
MRQREYIVYFPRGEVGGRTRADSEAQAVMHFLERTLGRIKGPRRADKMKADGLGLADFAVEIPEIFDEKGKPVSLEERDFLLPYALAQELATRRGGHPNDHFSEARYLLEASASN